MVSPKKANKELEIELILIIGLSNIMPIYLKGEKYLKGQIHVDSSSLSGVEELPENILVDVLNNERTLLDGATAGLVGNGNDQASSAIYEYSLWANLGEKLTCTPQDPRFKLLHGIIMCHRFYFMDPLII
ncbi:hypothetical protein Acr_13g0001930 [Actinidia rufa]|uniref:NOMO eighth prealbumin-like domain-containing protein n=1 Tax=Actinidia rufa TaxID=165716 RepID=A0A7J0FJC8_9ERIC|nr:hypothetical protein Acr_13g0001930 [Actinidia rufa]